MGLKGSDVRILPESKEDQEAASELAKQCIAPTAKANKTSIMTNLAKQVGGSRAGKTGNDLFDHFKSPLSMKKSKVQKESKAIAGMVKVKKPENKPKNPQKMSLIPSLSSLGKLGGSKKLPGVIIKKKEGPKLDSIEKPRNFWQDEDEIGGFDDTECLKIKNRSKNH